MNRALVPFVKTMLVAAIAVSGAAFAADHAAAPTKADPAKGGNLYANGDAARNIPACVSCHGDAGNSTIVDNPRLAGQHASYLYKQLVGFTTADRNNPVMTPFAKALTDDEKKDIAAYLASTTPKQGTAKNKDTLDLGKKIYRGGIFEKGVPACASCHGPTGAGIPVQYPRIASQHLNYTVAALTNFKSGARKNPQMQTIAKKMSDEEMKAVADYIAGLK
ncbi:cytochrome c [Massilia sp. TS11]|uniref:c-type cytochrome n=1 Tax=Massilia sp. TS11 TaxID=2908003 RepID=UPI001EDB8B44|nr:c-type cytochrome [Massilia sp. TS11]MCG2584899.1 cytochrome c4 [Massilia sp. TS11]